MSTKQGTDQGRGAAAGRKQGLPAGLCGIKRKEAVPMVSHTGTQEHTPSGQRLGCEDFCFTPMASPAFSRCGRRPTWGVSQVQGCIGHPTRSISNLKGGSLVMTNSDVKTSEPYVPSKSCWAAAAGRSESASAGAARSRNRKSEKEHQTSGWLPA